MAIRNFFKEYFDLKTLFCMFFTFIAYYFVEAKLSGDQYPSMINVIITLLMFIVMLFMTIAIATFNEKFENNPKKLTLLAAAIVITVGINILIDSYLDSKNLPKNQNVSYESKMEITISKTNKSETSTQEVESVPSKSIQKEANTIKKLDFESFFLKFLNKLIEFVAIASLVGFIGSYHPKKSKLEKTTAENLTEEKKPQVEYLELENLEVGNLEVENLKLENLKLEKLKYQTKKNQ